MGVRTEKAESLLDEQFIDHLQSIGYEYVNPSQMKASFNKRHAIAEERLFRFIKETQPSAFYNHKLETEEGKQKFLNVLSSKLTLDGVAKVIKEGIKMYPTGVIFFYHAFDKKRTSSFTEFESNLFSVTNQLTYSENSPGLELDICIY